MDLTEPAPRILSSSAEYNIFLILFFKESEQNIELHITRENIMKEKPEINKDKS